MTVLATWAGYSVQRINLLDLGSIARFEREIFPKDAYSVFDLSLLVLMPHIVNFKLLAPDHALAGFFSGSHSAGGGPGWIITIGIAATHQRQGLGRFLLTWCEGQLNAERIRLTVRCHNRPAIALYEQIGYVQVRRRRGYYGDGEDGFVMEKQML